MANLNIVVHLDKDFPKLKKLDGRDQAETRKWEGSPLITREGGSSSGLLSLKDRRECR